MRVLRIPTARVRRSGVVYKPKCRGISGHLRCKRSTGRDALNLTRCKKRRERWGILPGRSHVLLYVGGSERDELRSGNIRRQAGCATHPHPFRALKEEELVLDHRSGDRVPKLIARVAAFWNLSLSS